MAHIKNQAGIPELGELRERLQYQFFSVR